MRLESYAEGRWHRSGGEARELFHAVSGEKVAEVSSEGLDFRSMLEYARREGSPRLGRMTFHERARMLKALARYLLGRKEELYELSKATGATRSDSWLDIDGGVSTLFVYSSKGRKELPDDRVWAEGELERISREGTFMGQHVCVPLRGAAVHINAFNFPCWGMLEKLAPTWLAGMPAIVKPATISAFLAEKLVRLMVESQLLPEGALQLIAGAPGDLLDHLTGQDVVTFTGSAETGLKLRQHPVITSNSVRFNMEADSLNCCILGPDAGPDSEEFSLFVQEVAREMTVKAGQKCTAIRRTFVPRDTVEAALQALGARLASIPLGNPETEGVEMGPLAARRQVEEVRQRIGQLREAGEIAYGDPEDFEVTGAERTRGAFCPTVLLWCGEPFRQVAPHDVEAFGPVNTVMPYQSLEEAVELARLGRGSLVGSLFTRDDGVAREVVLGTAAYHGRLMLINRHSAAESTGHGSPLPHLVHGGPGRAGGGEEMGGIRGVLRYMQRTALQGSPTTLTRVCNQWMKGAELRQKPVHPFRKYFEELEIGETLITHRRTITEADVVNFACLSGDHFYAHTDEVAAADSFFEKRVAHGYLVLSAAAGLFVDPAPGPVLANYGLDDLRFIQPVYLGDTIRAKLTCMKKSPKDPRPEDRFLQGIVSWDVEVTNQNDELCASYTILTLVERKGEGDAPPEAGTDGQ